jgi:hypothetical protein
MSCGPQTAPHSPPRRRRLCRAPPPRAAPPSPPPALQARVWVRRLGLLGCSTRGVAGAARQDTTGAPRNAPAAPSALAIRRRRRLCGVPTPGAHHAPGLRDPNESLLAKSSLQQDLRRVGARMSASEGRRSLSWRPARHTCDSCVVLPDPVSPMTTTTSWAATALTISPAYCRMGSTGATGAAIGVNGR